MDIILLPALPAVTSVQAAFDVLTTSARSGLVTTIGRDPVLMTARGLKQVLYGPPLPLLEVPQFHKLPVVPQSPIWRDAQGLEIAPLGRPHVYTSMGSLPRESLTFFDAVIADAPQAMYFLLALAGGEAVVLTRSEEGGGARGKGPLSCSCEGEFEHELDQSDILPGSVCNRCGSAVNCRR